ncbi:DUF948 domain-containing protein [Glaciihabitans arcticus]|uniref:DUF948 domain-containing protein n=1 Tax=Glaciihabitans arcticus TaxID=2668039 RepID=A0A4Q9GQA6_9MICO|nr:DUF948 domain-containing protein [Glaciihabitans arcticus]TBN56775.1 DUF948 domain-containing protein [Glaciihabitans arcticus]
MSIADLAGLIAAIVFAILVALLAVPLLKLGRVLDDTSAAIRELSDNVTPLIEEATTTLTESNRQIARVDAITGDIAETTGNITALVSLFAATVGGPLMKIAAFSAGVRLAIRGSRAK